MDYIENGEEEGKTLVMEMREKREQANERERERLLAF